MGDDDALGVAHAARAVRRGMSDGGSGGLRLPGLLKGEGEREELAARLYACMPGQPALVTRVTWGRPKPPRAAESTPAAGAGESSIRREP